MLQNFSTKEILMTKITSKDLYNKIKSFKFSDSEIAIILQCGRNTIVKLKNTETYSHNNSRITNLLKYYNKLDLTFLKNLLHLNEINKKYENEIFQDKVNNFDNFYHFIQMFEYSYNFIENTPTYNGNLYKNLHQHIRNFHMRCNPYYMMMRTFFNKEIRPNIDFNIDFDKKLIKDLQILSFSSSKFNETALKNNYNLKYLKQLQDIINRNTEKLSKRCQNELKTISFSKTSLDITTLSFNDFIKLLYLLSISYTEDENIRFNIYEDSELNKINYIKNQMTKRDAKKYGNLFFYNFARFFNKDKNYYLLEDVLFNYNFHKIENLDKDKYQRKLYQDVEFRINQTMSLIEIVSGLNYKNGDNYEFIFDGDDEISSEPYNNTRIEKIKSIMHSQEEEEI